MTAFTVILLLWTLAMLGLHLASRPILQGALRSRNAGPAWFSVANIVRFEGLYYVALLSFWWLVRARFPFVPLILLGVIHIGGWMLAEARRSALAVTRLASGPTAARLERIVPAIQIFDLAEAVVLLYIGWKLVLPFL